jgi:RIO kinase 1
MRIPDSLESLVSEGIITEVVRPLMSGKEAQVYLVESGGELRVAKIYKDAINRSFKHRAEYTEGRGTRSSRDARAIQKRSKYGRAMDEEAWRSAEVDVIYRLRSAGVRVPEPFQFVDGVLIMELVKDAYGDPAPRLGDVDLGPVEARRVFDQLLRETVRMLCADVVHGDLSSFNVLIDAAGPVIIDFPQSVDASKNQTARELLVRDVDNLTHFLSRYEPAMRNRPYGQEIWAAYETNELTPDTVLTGTWRPAAAVGEGRELPARRQGPAAAAGPGLGLRPGPGTRTALGSPWAASPRKAMAPKDRPRRGQRPAQGQATPGQSAHGQRPAHGQHAQGRRPEHDRAPQGQRPAPGPQGRDAPPARGPERAPPAPSLRSAPSSRDTSRERDHDRAPPAPDRRGGPNYRDTPHDRDQRAAPDRAAPAPDRRGGPNYRDTPPDRDHRTAPAPAPDRRGGPNYRDTPPDRGHRAAPAPAPDRRGGPNYRDTPPDRDHRAAPAPDRRGGPNYRDTPPRPRTHAARRRRPESRGAPNYRDAPRDRGAPPRTDRPPTRRDGPHDREAPAPRGPYARDPRRCASGRARRGRPAPTTPVPGRDGGARPDGQERGGGGSSSRGPASPLKVGSPAAGHPRGLTL